MSLLACDLEYVQVSGGRSVMAKCAIVNLACEIILNITVKPAEHVTCYVSCLTGIIQCCM